MIYHKQRENVWSLLYCIVLQTAEPTNTLTENKDNCLLLLKESLTAWGCVDIGSYVTEEAFVIKTDAPLNLDIPTFINAFKTRVGRFYKSGKRGLFRAGYMVSTMGSPTDRPEDELLKIREENKS